MWVLAYFKFSFKFWSIYFLSFSLLYLNQPFSVDAAIKLKKEFVFQTVAYRPTVYKTGVRTSDVLHYLFPTVEGPFFKVLD